MELELIKRLCYIIAMHMTEKNIYTNNIVYKIYIF